MKEEKLNLEPLSSDKMVLSTTLVRDMLFGLVRISNFHRVYLNNYSEPRSKFFT